MSEREPRGRGPERQPPREQEPYPYLRAARFAGAALAGVAYDAAQDLLFHRRNVDLSAFRFQLDQVYHVAVLGFTPPALIDRAIARILARGEPASLPPEIIALLRQRRRTESRQGSWVEKHYRPGRRFEPPGR